MHTNNRKTPAELRAEFEDLSTDMGKRAEKALRDLSNIGRHAPIVDEEIEAEADHAMKQMKRLSSEKDES
ncbi:hypothetical protein HY627_01825 [Candidatus Uhrbacteria bacterium]|nr:hypothetical protein [Candidatus Uhrbacteria bacterium]